jgi:hypothetical protein
MKRYVVVLMGVLLALGCGSKEAGGPGQPAPSSGGSGGSAASTGGSGGPGGAGGSSGTSGVGGVPIDEVPDEPGVPIDPSLLGEDGARVQGLLNEAKALDASSLAAKRKVTFQEELGYDPLQAEGFALLQASNLSLTDAEQAALQQHGFAVLARHEFPSMFYAYLTIYGEDLPVFVSGDSVLDAVHRSYDDILAGLERTFMVGELKALVSAMRASIAGQSDETAADAELFLAVGQALLEGSVPSPLHAGVQASEVQELLDAAVQANGIKNKTLFGVARDFDFSQFKPRGHYEGDPILEPYFRAMMWFGRTDFRLIGTGDDGKPVFHRRQLEAALRLRALMTPEARSSWDGLDAIVTAFVGEHDYMVLPELDQLLEDLGVSELDDSVSDEQIVAAIRAGSYGEQRICSQVMVNGGDVATLPLGRSFAFFGQRYTVDSHVFSNVVYDRVGGGSIDRWLPNPLDAAYAALGNDHAVELLQSELTRYPYAPDLEAMRLLVDDHDESYWDSSLYTLWLSALRTLSPSQPNARPDAAGLPSIARSEAWGRRLVNTQLASWSQLRHDTLLYVKQSYTVGTVCEFPDAYVDPYPELFAKIRHFAVRGNELIGQLEANGALAGATVYFDALAEVMVTLEEMAEAQRTGMPHSAEHLAFINDVVKVEGGGSGPPSVTGWYARLFANPQRALENDPIIADVHTDVGGVERPAKILHVATSLPRAMVMTVDTCVGPRLYVGPAFAYHELPRGGLDRMTDSEWSAHVTNQNPDEAPWMQGIVVPR